jgi:hypothetical protein
MKMDRSKSGIFCDTFTSIQFKNELMRMKKENIALAEKCSLSERSNCYASRRIRKCARRNCRKYWRAATNDIQAVSRISNSFYFPVYKTSHFCSFLLIWIFHKERRHYIFKFEAILEASCE